MAQSSQSVGFSFQGDVFAGGTLAFSATGRILKQISDARIDLYALYTLIQLGGELHISDQQEYKVAAAIKKRSKSRRDYLAKSLTIGWGFCDLVYEISKTKGGCSALLLLSAFTAGTSTLAAAQAMRELMRLNSCDEPLLPSAPTLSHVISVFAPIMEDSGFLSVQQLIYMTCAQRLGQLSPNPYRSYAKKVTELMKGNGNVRQWAHAAQQLIFTASKNESIYIEAACMAAWLATFATSILEMECTVLHGSDELWKATGRNGKVVIQIAQGNAKQSDTILERTLITHGEIGSVNSLSIRKLKLDLTKSKFSDSYLASTYELRNAFTTSISLIPGLSKQNIEDIESAIVTLPGVFARKLPFRPLSMNTGYAPIDYRPTCSYLGIDRHSTKGCPSSFVGDLGILKLLSEITLRDLKLLSCCCPEDGRCNSSECLLLRIEAII